MVMSPQEIAAPADPAMQPGGSYMNPLDPVTKFMPSEPPAVSRDSAPIPAPAPSSAPAAPSPMQAAPAPTMNDEMSKASRGLLSQDYNDVFESMNGIVNGDPIGMETFDLGFYEDGTPALVINGTPVPVRHEQWMALMTQRSKMREELRAQAMFANDVQKAQESIAKVGASIPSMPRPMIDLFMSQASINPQRALENLSSSYVAMQKDGGRGLMGGVAAEMQTFKNENSFGFMLREGPKTTRMEPNPFNPKGPPIEISVPGKSRRDLAVEALRGSKEPWSQVTMLAYEKLEDFALDPNIRKVAPTGQFGIFDRIVMMESDKIGPLSLFNRLRHIASYGGSDYGGSVQMQAPGALMVTGYSSVPTGAPMMPQMATTALDEYRKYLQELDRWAANAFGYDPSTSDAIDAMALNVIEAIGTPQPAQEPNGNARPSPALRRPSAIGP